MRLYEFQAKKIFSEYGINIPNGKVAYSSEEAVKIAAEIGTPIAIKAQILVGGRGLAGGIKFADYIKQAEKRSSQILAKSLKNQDVNCLLIEEKLDILTEYYLGVTIDFKSKCPVVIASPKGGVDIEKIASDHPDQIFKEEISLSLGLTDFQTRRIAKKIGILGRNQLKFAAIVKSLYTIFQALDATLVEINPLALTTNDQIIAADAKMTLDDNASFRHRELYSRLKSVGTKPKEGKRLRKAMAKEAGIPTYIELSKDIRIRSGAGITMCTFDHIRDLGGNEEDWLPLYTVKPKNIGIISDGAGTGMCTFDLTRDSGGKIKSYCELGGRATPDLIEKSIEIVSSNKNIRVILINLIGGLNRMDEMAQGIISFLSKEKHRKRVVVKPSIVVRMSGTLEDEGRRILGNAGVASYDNIYDAIEKAVKLSVRN